MARRRSWRGRHGGTSSRSRRERGGHARAAAPRGRRAAPAGGAAARRMGEGGRREPAARPGPGCARPAPPPPAIPVRRRPRWPAPPGCRSSSGAARRRGPGTPSGVGGASLMPKPGRGRRPPARGRALSAGAPSRGSTCRSGGRARSARPRLGVERPWPFSARWELERHQRSPGRIGPPLPLARRFSSAGTRTQTRWPPTGSNRCRRLFRFRSSRAALAGDDLPRTHKGSLRRVR